MDDDDKPVALFLGLALGHCGVAIYPLLFFVAGDGRGVEEALGTCLG